MTETNWTCHCHAICWKRLDEYPTMTAIPLKKHLQSCMIIFAQEAYELLSSMLHYRKHEFYCKGCLQHKSGCCPLQKYCHNILHQIIDDILHSENIVTLSGCTWWRGLQKDARWSKHPCVAFGIPGFNAIDNTSFRIVQKEPTCSNCNTLCCASIFLLVQPLCFIQTLLNMRPLVEPRQLMLAQSKNDQSTPLG